MLWKIKWSFLDATIMALQIFGIVPCVAKGKGSLKKDCSRRKNSEETVGILRMEVSDLMCIWCLFLRVLYLVGLIFIVEQSLNDFSDKFPLLSIIGIPFLCTTLPFNSLYAPLKYKTNIRLLNKLLELKTIYCYKTVGIENISRETCSVIILLIIWLLAACFDAISTTSLVWVEKVFMVFAASYFFGILAVQVLFFECCCSVLTESVPNLKFPQNQTEMNNYASAVKKVKKINKYIYIYA